MLSSETLLIPQDVIQWILPPAQGYNRNRESFPTNALPAFDPEAIYESASSQIIDLLTNPDRITRLYNQNALDVYFEEIRSYLVKNRNDKLTNVAENLYVLKLVQLKYNESLSMSIKSAIDYELNNYNNTLYAKSKNKNIYNKTQKAHLNYLWKLLKLEMKDVKTMQVQSVAKLPPGQPIGCTLE
jgi:hypothetical protein